MQPSTCLNPLGRQSAHPVNFGQVTYRPMFRSPEFRAEHESETLFNDPFAYSYRSPRGEAYEDVFLVTGKKDLAHYRPLVGFMGFRRVRKQKQETGQIRLCYDAARPQMPLTIGTASGGERAPTLSDFQLMAHLLAENPGQENSRKPMLSLPTLAEALFQQCLGQVGSSKLIKVLVTMLQPK